MSAFVLTCDGSPYAFGTGGVTTLPTPATGYSDDWSTAWTIAPGILDWSDGFSWVERMKPLDGDLDVGGLTFKLHDASFDGKTRLLSYLATRVPRAITQCRITSTLATAIGTFTVDDGSGFPSGAQVVWIDGEAIHCSGRVGNTFTMDARGYYGTVARSHTVRANGEEGSPTVWGEFPWITRRRLILWLVDDANVATPIWRGYAMRAPKLASDGARFELQANSLWSVEKSRTFIEDSYSTRLAGYNAAALGLYVLTFNNSNGGSSNNRYLSTKIVYRHAEGLCGYLNGDHTPELAGEIKPNIRKNNPGVTVNDETQLSVVGDELEFRVSINYGGGVILHPGTITPMINVGAGERYQATSTQTSDPRIVSVRAPLPGALVLLPETTPGPIPVDSVANLPTTYSTESFTNGAYRTTIAASLRGEFDDDLALEVRPVSASFADTNLQEPQPAITGTARFVAKTPAGARKLAERQHANNGYAWYQNILVTSALPITYALTIEGSHWAYALKHTLHSSVLAKTGADGRNWDWTNIDDLVAASAVPAIEQASWSFTGKQKLGELVVGRAALFGCGLGIRGSRLTIIPFRRAISGEAPVASFTRADFVAKARPTYSAFPDGLANSARLTTEDVELNVRYVDSVKKYGETRTIELKVDGIKLPSGLDSTYESYVQLVLPRILYLWGEPVQTVEIPVSLAWLNVVALGDVVTIEEDTLPDGIGGRGLGNAASLTALGATAQYGFVIGRRVEIKPGSDGIIWLELLIQPVGVGYAPCMRVNAGTVTATTVSASTSFIVNASGIAHYSGYSTEHNGGADYFKAGDVVQFVQRNVTTLATLGPYVVQSSSGGVITFTAPLPAPTQTALAVAGSQWDLRYANYSDGTALQASQETYAFVGSRSTGKIGTSADIARNWSP